MALSSHNGALIDLRDVVKTYETGAGDVTVLKDVTLRVQGGEYVSIVGPSGSGKSTLLNMITGIDRPTGGEVLVGGEGARTSWPAGADGTSASSFSSSSCCPR
jgi:putative ABC transport system ATP-binding protein